MCQTCNGKILPRELYVEIGNHFFHSNDSCLHCSSCHQSIVGHLVIFQRDKKLFCNRYCALGRDPAI